MGVGRPCKKIIAINSQTGDAIVYGSLGIAASVLGLSRESIRNHITNGKELIHEGFPVTVDWLLDRVEDE